MGVYYIYIYPPAPADSRGSASENRDKRGKRQEKGLPWCFGLASGPFDRSCAGRKPAARGRKQVGSKKHGALARPAREEGQLLEQASKLAAGSAGRQASWRFEASFYAVQKATFGSMGYRPRARSVIHCHGALALRDGPVTGAVQDESQLQ